MTDPIDVLLSMLPPGAELDEEVVQKWRARMAEPLADISWSDKPDPDGLRTYILQNSDWDCADGQGIFVTTVSPEEAVKKVVDRGGFDGAHFKIATLNLIGFMGWEHEQDFDEFQPLTERGEQPILCTEKS